MWSVHFRNHLNDLENIPAFVLVGIFYLMIRPDPALAIWHFRIFFLSRVCHTFAYQMALPQPSRALAYTVGQATTFSMIIRLLVATWKAY